MDFIYILLQLTSAILVAPLFDGISRKLRAKFQSRIGPSIFQTYYDIYKLLKEEEQNQVVQHISIKFRLIYCL